MILLQKIENNRHFSIKNTFIFQMLGIVYIYNALCIAYRTLIIINYFVHIKIVIQVY